MCCLRLSNLPPMSDLKSTTKWTLALLRQRAGVRLITTSPPRSFPPAESPWMGALHCYISQLESDLKALQGSTEALKSRPFTHWGRTELDVISWAGGVCVRVFLPALQHGRLLERLEKKLSRALHTVFVSMRLHSVKCAQRTWKHTVNGVKKEQKEQKKKQRSCDWRTKSNTLVSQSHSPFFSSFIFYRWGHW